MKNTVKSQAEFRKYCISSEKGCYFGTFIIGALALVGIVSTFHCIYTKAGSWADNLMGGLELLTVALSFWFTSEIFKSMKKANTPFAHDVSEKITKLAKCIDLGAAICVVVSLILKITGHKFNIEEISCIDPVTFMIIAWAISGFMRSLAKTYAYGAELQRESDETL